MEGIGDSTDATPLNKGVVLDVDRGPEGSGRARRVLQAVLLSVPVVGYVGAGWAHRWITDDGFIYLRIVQQIRAGHGPVFNEGERVEAFTGVLWVALLSLADLFTPVRLEWIAVLLGLAAGAAGLVLAMAGARRLWPPDREDRWFLPFGAVVFAAVLPAWVFATSGLETGLSFAWLGGCLFILAGWARSPDTTVSLPWAVFLGLGWLVRPELVLFSAAFLLVVVGAQWSRDRWSARIRVAAAMVALPLAYQFFRMGFYGSLMANTAIAKEGSRLNWDRGWTYLRDFADPYWLWVPALALLAGGYLPLAARLSGHRRSLAVAGVFLACGLLNVGYTVAVGGDYLHARLLLPGFFALGAPVAAIPATRRHLAALTVVPWSVAAVLSLRPVQLTSGNAFAHLVFFPKQTIGKVTLEDFGWDSDGPKRAWYEGPALYYQSGRLGAAEYAPIDVALKPEVDLPVGVLRSVGIAAYAMGPDFRVIDLLGLADAFTGHLHTSTIQYGFIPRLPGHEKPLPTPWLVARLTPEGAEVDPTDFPSGENPLIPPTTGREFEEQVAWARAALGCDEIAELVRVTEASLTAGRFFENFWGSFGNTRLRIPADPEEAYHRFCGSGTPPEVRALTSG